MAKKRSGLHWTPEELASYEARQRAWADRKVAALVVDPTLTIRIDPTMTIVGDHPRDTTPVVDKKPAEVIHKPRFRSKWEAQYASQLGFRLAAGDIRGWGYETLKLGLPGGIWHLMDFVVTPNSGVLQLHSVKGRMREPARIKMRQVMEVHPYFEFYIVQGDLMPKRLYTPDDVPPTTR